MNATSRSLVSLGTALWLFFILACPALGQYGDFCDVCGRRLTGTAYLVTDKMSGQRKQVCADCEFKLPPCFLCGLPTLTNVQDTVHLPDGRTLCARDGRTAVYREDEGARVCQEVKEALQRQFSRFLSFPANNISFEMIDRIHLQSLFKISGNDYQCPNVWGHTISSSKGGRCEHHVSVLSGLPLGWFQTTCAHEFTHAWIFENVPAARKRTLSNPAEEGFCELLGYLFADSLRDENAKSNILANAYTRGQIQVMVETERQFGVNEIIDWMKYGAYDRLDPANLGRVREIVATQTTPRPAVTALAYARPAPEVVPDTLVLKAVFWNESRPSALINGSSLFPNEQAKVRLGNTNLLVRCLEIKKDAVRVRLVATGEEQELKLKGR